MYELSHELPNDLRIETIRLKKYQKTDSTLQNDSLMPSPPAKTKVLSILEENSSKIEIKLFSLRTISNEN